MVQIALIGRLRSGKTTVVEMLIEIGFVKYGLEFKEKKLGTPIYEVAKEFYEKNGLTWVKNRRLLEGIGLAFNEHYPKGDKLLEIYNENYDINDSILCDDVRRIGQADFFRKNKKPILRVFASDQVRKDRCKEGEWSTGHITDIELDSYKEDYFIDNNHNDLEKLYNSTENILDKIVKEWFNYE